MVGLRELSSPADLDAAYVLRHRVCVEELSSVPSRPDRRETDVWDDGALHVGAFAGHSLIGYVRVVSDSPERGIMTRGCFGELFDEPDPRPPPAVTGDLSRLILDPGHRSPRLGHQLIVGLVDFAQRLSQARGLDFWYLVTGDAGLTVIRQYYADVRVLGCGTTSDGDTNCILLVGLASRIALAQQRPAC